MPGTLLEQENESVREKSNPRVKTCTGPTLPAFHVEKEKDAGKSDPHVKDKGKFTENHTSQMTRLEGRELHFSILWCSLWIDDKTVP